MANSSLTFTIFGKDVSASKALKGVAETAGGVGKKLGGVGLAFAGMGTAAVAGAAVAAGAIAGDALRAASDLNETVSKTATIFGNEAMPALEAYAEAAGKNLGLAKGAALDAVDTFAIVGKGAGLSGKNLQGFSTDLTTLAGDFASFYNSSPEDAVTAIGAALRGESEPIRRFGVLLDDATLRTRALKLGLIKSTKEGLTPQQKALAAQAEIMVQSKVAQGDFARTSSGLANQQRIMAAEFENASSELGTALLPGLTNLAKWVTGSVIPAVKTMSAWLGEHLGPTFQQLGGWIMSTLVPAMRSLFVWMGENLVPVIQQLGGWITGTLVPAAQALATGFMENVWPALKQVGGMVIDNLKPAFESFVEYWKNDLLPAIQRAWPFFQKVIVLFAGIVAAVVVVISWLVGKLFPVFARFIGIVVGVASRVGEAVSTIIDHFGDIVDFVKNIPGKIGSFLSGVADVIKAPFRTAFNGIASLWNGTVGKLSFTAPEWIPGFGGKGWSVPNIPMLAKGGIVTRPTLALIGEAGPEAVVPLGRGGGMGQTINVYVTQPLGRPQDIARAVAAATTRAGRNGAIA